MKMLAISSATRLRHHLLYILLILSSFVLSHLVLVNQYGADYLERIQAGELLPDALIGIVVFPMLIMLGVGFLLLRKPRK